MRNKKCPLDLVVRSRGSFSGHHSEVVVREGLQWAEEWVDEKAVGTVLTHAFGWSSGGERERMAVRGKHRVEGERCFSALFCFAC